MFRHLPVRLSATLPLWLGLVAPASAQVSTIDPAQLAADLQYLSADQQQGRGVGTAGLDSAAAYIAAQMRNAGLTPAFGSSFLQSFAIDPSAPAAAHAGLRRTQVANVIGLIPGSGRLAGQAVVIGAHYDHLGSSGFSSLEPDAEGKIHNGADDNASGTAALIAIGRSLATRRAPDRRTVVLIAFTAEELGLIGSTHYVEHPVIANDSTFAMINMDMVGRLEGGTLAAFGGATASEFPAILGRINGSYGLTLDVSGDGYGRSDQQSFFTKNIPVLHFFTGTHEDYHRPSDDFEKIDINGVETVARFVADVTWNLAIRTASLTFVDAEPPPPVASGGYGAYLGSIPDMSSSPQGVRLTGVRSGSPGDLAGLQAGDIIIGLGPHEVGDLYQMTDALQKLKPGEKITVRVLRDGKEVSLEATLGQRGG